jgi:hypothetical protein
MTTRSSRGIVQSTGVDEETARVFASFGIAARNWYLAPVSSAVAQLTGRAPKRVHEMLAAHRAQLVPA